MELSDTQGPEVGTTGALDEFAGLVTRWKRARGPMDQVRVIASGSRTLGAMSPDDRRVLARSVAEQGAPELAARLDPGGGARPSSGELTELTRSLFSVDRAELDGVAASLGDPDERRRLLRGAASAVADADLPPPPTGPPIALPPPPQPPTRREAPARSSAAPGSPDPERPDPEPADPGPPDPEPTDPEPTDPGPADPGPADPGPADREASDRASRVLPGVQAPVAEVLDSIRSATSARERLAAVARLEGAPLRGEDLAALLTLVPDGWQRRTAAKRLLVAGDVDHLDPIGTLDTFARVGDRIALAGVLVDAGLADPATVAAALPERAADRLRRRAGVG